MECKGRRRKGSAALCPMPWGPSPRLLHSGQSWSAHGLASPSPGDELTVAFTIQATSAPGRAFRHCDRPTGEKPGGRRSSPAPQVGEHLLVLRLASCRSQRHYGDASPGLWLQLDRRQAALHVEDEMKSWEPGFEHRSAPSCVTFPVQTSAPLFVK